MAQRKTVIARVRPYLYVAPTVIFIVAIFLYPIIDLFRRSLFKLSDNASEFMGLTNFYLVFEDPIFWQALGNNLRLFVAVPLLLTISLIVSTILYERIRGWRLYRFAIFIPYILSISVVGIVFTFLLGYRGIFNQILKFFGLSFMAQDWLGEPGIAIFSIMGIVIWKEVGFGIILFLARLMSVQEELYESALLDGANWWQLMWHITIPQLSTVIEFYVLINLISLLSWMFNYIYVMTRGGPGTSTYVLDFFVYQNAFRFSQPGIAAALSLLLLAVASVLVFGQAIARRRLEEMQ
jgi:ABC-type sugar transport system permease subunit